MHALQACLQSMISKNLLVVEFCACPNYLLVMGKERASTTIRFFACVRRLLPLADDAAQNDIVNKTN